MLLEPEVELRKGHFAGAMIRWERSRITLRRGGIYVTRAESVNDYFNPHALEHLAVRPTSTATSFTRLRWAKPFNWLARDE